MKMYPSVWFFNILLLLIVDMRIGALPDSDIEPLQCHQCNTTNCNQLQSIRCSANQPYCISIATAPHFTNTLSCGAMQESTCVLEHEVEQFQLTCICKDNLCNAPYNQRLRNELLNFSTNFRANSSAKLTEIFLKLSGFANFSNEVLYETFTTNSITTSAPAITPTIATQLASLVNSTALFNVSAELLPRALALKHEATVPPDDDEDENEGSGTSIDDSKANEHAAPAAPSSYLPANGNSAQILVLNSLLLITPLCLHLNL